MAAERPPGRMAASIGGGMAGPPGYRRAMPRPRILVTCSLNDHEAATRTLVGYCDPVHAAGGLPLVAPAFTDPATVDAALAAVAGVLLIGGPDYHPDAYGGRPQPADQLMDRRRHDADLLLARTALARWLPVFGICGGLQLLVIARGGALIQDLPSDLPAAIPHTATGEGICTHPVAVVPGSRLAGLVGAGPLSVNSYHHQAALPGRTGGLVVSATAPDGVIEAVEDPALPFCLGVQWHPERLADQPASRALFAGLVAAARLHAG
jgi:putative glutamine amidotransferase